MPVKREWIPDEDAIVMSAVETGGAFQAVADVLGLSRWTVRERARTLGMTGYTRAAGRAGLIPVPCADWIADPNRAPLPPGHPETWGAIIAGTCLDGSEYPL